MLDPSEYYSKGKFMTVDNNVHGFLKALARHASGAISLLHMQLLAAAYQHAVLRDAYAIAKALGRILVLPRVYAWCDWDPAPTVLFTCALDCRAYVCLLLHQSDVQMPACHVKGSASKWPGLRASSHLVCGRCVCRAMKMRCHRKGSAKLTRLPGMQMCVC